jgi:hypothetical protein
VLRAAGTIAVAIVVLASGCSGAGNGSDAAAGEDPEPPEPPPTTTAQVEDEEAALPDPQGWATRAELAWLRPYGVWSKRVDQAARSLLSIREGAALVRGLEDEEADAVARFDRLLAPLRSCGQDFAAHVPPPPTERIAEAAALVEAACGHWARVAEDAMTAVRNEGDSAQGQTGQALRRAASASMLVTEKLPPGEAQRLPIRDAKGKRSRINGRYGQVAGTLVETNVEVRCWAARDWRRVLREASLVHATRLRPAELYGYVGLGSRRVNLSSEICAQLDRLAYDGVQPEAFHERLLMSVAVGALAHESYHRAGVAAEPAAECYGMQRLDEAARALGARPDYAAGLSRLAWETYDQLPRAYRSRECRDGGELDLDQASGAPWP